MKRNSKKAIALATAMTIAMGMSVSAFASAPGTTSVKTSSEVVNATFSVVLPTTPTLTLDPYEIAKKTQIYGQNFAVINKSNIPVTVTVTGSLDLAEGVAGKAAIDVDTASKDIKNASKVVALNLVPAKTATLNAGWTAIDPAGTPALAYDTVAANMAAVGVETAGKALGGLTFNLNGAGYASSSFNAAVDGVVAGIKDKAHGAFTVNGKLNSNAIWEDDDVNVDFKFTIKGQSAAQYTATVMKAGTTNLSTAVNSAVIPRGGVDPSVSQLATFDNATTDPVELGTFSYGAITPATSAVKGITKVEFGTSGLTALTKDTDYTLAEPTATSSGVITLTPAGVLKFTTADTYTVKVTFSVSATTPAPATDIVQVYKVVVTDSTP